MAASTAPSAELRAEDVRQLWSLARLLAQKKLTMQTAQCLKPLCALDCSIRSAEEQAILLQANILLAEICSVACSNKKKADPDLWTRRVIQTEECIHSADAAIARGISCSHENRLRLLKAKFLLQQQLKIDRAAKNRRMLEILCEGLISCAEAEDDDHELAAEFRKYFGVKLKACLVKMHAATVKAKYSKDNDAVTSLADNLKYLRTTLPSSVDKHFLLWLVEVTCHTAISSFQPENAADMHQLVAFGQEFFDKVALEHPVSRDFRIHHLIITGFYYLRTGKLAKVTPLLEQIQALVRGTGSGDQQLSGVLKDRYLNTILDSMRVAVLACSDSKQALDLALTTAVAAQANLNTYDKYPAVQLMLIATLFDMVYVYCRLLGLQCRYADLGASIAQMTTLFAKYKSHLERSIFYRFFLARCHTLIAKYATAIGKVKEACSHLNFVVDKVLPAPTNEEMPYPDAYLAVWVDVLEVAMYCCGETTQSSPLNDSATALHVRQIYPSRVLLKWVTRILKSDGLRHQVNQCCSVELKAKYNLALAKWMWATERLSSDSDAAHFTQHTELEELRPKAFTLLHEALQHMNTSVMCCETTSETMALFGPHLVAYGKMKEGEEILKNAIDTSLQTKNVLLQTRLCADVFQFYSNKGLIEEKATIASKYEKKLALLQRRIAAAQAENATTTALLRWTAGSKASKPSRG
ncbi:hypothetical protein F441_11308 [Phytophthora nicotianae CJ01A1]|uniref:Uncharacterized protein n=5 Tax=Phytophthora nicotianae TaxID=4792 RepID=V9EY53_PHYNI|nr:hypothetical protein F443_11391 [Phytophthora nicotianae P1569]ETK83861.1 hypothetical protein L915_11081 [Phytophthora nicotianae]ETO72472.1 hypothetical protein F444_11461 [Phytophthora nicotianae P1976]ETP13607.1 hypothetical protein F441_11308 [Phytophthora nicotianae CJ01A1]ETP41670.1 hypothetical protein F442_11276 [Phytophthora nicotianae P10297]